MKQSEFNVAKKLFAKYKKITISSLSRAFSSSFVFTFLRVWSRIKDIKAGEYPLEPMDIIIERLNEEMPGIIISSIITGLLIMIVLFIVYLIFYFRKEYNIYVIHEIKLYLNEKKALKK